MVARGLRAIPGPQEGQGATIVALADKDQARMIAVLSDDLRRLGGWVPRIPKPFGELTRTEASAFIRRLRALINRERYFK